LADAASSFESFVISITNKNRDSFYLCSINKYKWTTQNIGKSHRFQHLHANFEREMAEGTAVTEADKLPINMQRIKRILKQ
jgi:hypothetical protein